MTLSSKNRFQNHWSLIISVCGVLTTILVTPWFNYDPINYVKLLSLTSLSFMTFTLVILGIRKKFVINKTLLYLIVTFILILILPILIRPTPWQTQIWGAWGRATGILAFISLALLLFSSSNVNSISGITIILKCFIRTSYFISIYSTIQIAELDPIPWSQKLPVATLGNINFMSAFLGMANILLLGYVIYAKSTLTQRIFYIIVISWNTFLIFFTESIQGFLMFCVGSLVYLLNKSNFFHYSFIKKFLSLSIFSLFSGLVAIGGVGLGPLGKFLAQETLLYRLDYWGAGVRMTLDNALLGVGIDGYGARYREYRDLVATLRTGPQRVSNTAHNVFLDVSSGGGIPLLIAMLAIFLLVTFFGIKNLKLELNRELSIPIFAMWVSFLAFNLISINQLGVTVWGWILGGLILALNRMSRLGSSHTKKLKSEVSQDNLDFQEKDGRFKVFSGALAFILGISLVMPQLVSDGKFLAAVREKDGSRMVLLSQGIFSNEFMIEKTLNYLVESNESEKSLEFARWAIKRNPQDLFAWNVLRLLVVSSVREKLLAIERLREMDPRNQGFLNELEEQKKQLKG